VALYMHPVRVYKVSCLLLQAAMLGLAGLMYPSSRLPLWLIPGMLNMRTRWVVSSSPVCPKEHLVIISYTTGLSFALERIGPLTTINIYAFIYSYFI
jgi:hypothetical protein